MNYLVLDTETSGLISDDVRIVQIGYCNVVDDKVVQNEQINLFPSPGMKMSEKAEATHGLSIEHLKETGVDPKIAFTSLRESLQSTADKGSYIVGHNLVGFDSKVLNIEFKRNGCPEFDFSSVIVVDTGMIYKAHKIWWQRAIQEPAWDFMVKVGSQRSKTRWNLQECCRSFEIPFNPEDAHGAAYDCLKTREVLQEIINRGILYEVLGDLNE